MARLKRKNALIEAHVQGVIDTAAVDGLKVLDPERPIREADIAKLVNNAQSMRALQRALLREVKIC
jgi:ATP-dependent exoDNAse (exonuclease V) beta subunit